MSTLNENNVNDATKNKFDGDNIVEIKCNKTGEDMIPWKDLGLVDVLCKACMQLKWNIPSKIQRESIPLALQGKDIIGLAETGSGKTAAFALPILQALLENPQRYFALILTPTRELAFQIAEQFEALGANIGVKCAVIVGGMDMVTQALILAKKPHILIATPGRLIDHLENTKGFSLRALKYLVMDEADRILNMDFEVEVDKILKVIPRERRTLLFSATMTKKVKKLQRACLQDPVKVEVSTKYQTVEKLLQYYLFVPVKFKFFCNTFCHLKTLVYRTPVNSVEELRERIIANREVIKQKEGIFHRVRRNFLRRINLCIEEEGRHFEPLI